MRARWRCISIFSVLFILLSKSGMAADKIPVFVSIVPQQYFVEQIGKDLVDVKVMVLPGASPATYEPKPKQMAALSKTRLYFAIGVPFENAWLKKIASANPNMLVVHTDHGIQKIPMAAHYHHDEHESGLPEGEHDHDTKGYHDEKGYEEDHHGHTGRDPHVWLSPALVKVQAKTILLALQESDPYNKSIYERNFNSFIGKIDQLDADLKKLFAGKEGLQFMVFHPSWGYFAKDYSLKQVPLELEGKDPKPAQLKELIKHARDKGIKVVFVQTQFSTKSAKLVAREIGGQVVFADPLAEDWMVNLQQVADKFQAVLK